jgi:NAD(P)H-nitrite reductase large subunit
MEEIKPVPGLIPQKDGSFAITIECPNGIVSPEIMSLVSELSKRHNFITHLTIAQKIMLLGMNMDVALDVLNKLDSAGAIVRKARDLCHPRVCVGTPFCKLALQDTFSLGEYLYKETSRIPIPPKMKIAIAGCPANCTWAMNIDLGFMGLKSGYNVFIGGKGGTKPQMGIEVGKITTHEEAAEIVRRLSKLFSENVKIKSRVAHLVNKLGIEEVKKQIGF